jgi:hypothetical protein
MAPMVRFTQERRHRPTVAPDLGGIRECDLEIDRLLCPQRAVDAVSGLGHDQRGLPPHDAEPRPTRTRDICLRHTINSTFRLGHPRLGAPFSRAVPTGRVHVGGKIGHFVAIVPGVRGFSCEAAPLATRSAFSADSRIRIRLRLSGDASGNTGRPTQRMIRFYRVAAADGDDIARSPRVHR